MPDFQYEDAARALGKTAICGIDEAGRGPLAGPVSVAAVILPDNFFCEGLNDSKKLSAKKRDILYRQLVNDPHVKWAQVFADAAEIDRTNILRATHNSMAAAVTALQEKYQIAVDFCLIDGLTVPKFPYPQQSIVKGDGKSLSIAAASIIAKVARDEVMLGYAKEFPEYGFDAHMGYGTKAHLLALSTYGPCRIHRRTFQPISQLSLPFGP